MKPLLALSLFTIAFIGCNNNLQGTVDTIPQDTLQGDVNFFPLAIGNIWEYWYSSERGIRGTPPEEPAYTAYYTRGIHRYTLLARIADTLWQCERAFADSTFIKVMNNQTTFVKDSILIDTIEISSGGEFLYSITPDMLTSSKMNSWDTVSHCIVRFEDSDITIGMRFWMARMDWTSWLYTPSIGLVCLRGGWAWTSGSGETNLTLLSFNGIPYDGAKLYDFAQEHKCQ